VLSWLMPTPNTCIGCIIRLLAEQHAYWKTRKITQFWVRVKYSTGMLLLLICIFNLLIIIDEVGNFFKNLGFFSWLIDGLYKFSRWRRLLNLYLASTCKISFPMSSWHQETYEVMCVCKEDALDNVKLKESVWALFLLVCVCWQSWWA